MLEKQKAHTEVQAFELYGAPGEITRAVPSPFGPPATLALFAATRLVGLPTARFVAFRLKVHTSLYL
jgi:hypothetical protein